MLKYILFLLKYFFKVLNADKNKKGDTEKKQSKKKRLKTAFLKPSRKLTEEGKKSSQSEQTRLKRMIS